MSENVRGRDDGCRFGCGWQPLPTTGKSLNRMHLTSSQPFARVGRNRGVRFESHAPCSECSSFDPLPWRARVRRLSPPSDPSQEQPSGAPRTPPAPRVLVPNSEALNTKALSQPPEKARDEVVLIWSQDVPVGSRRSYSTVWPTRRCGRLVYG
ncbi:uncharacterized protein B0H18DRAFT_219979 [Fomitopsis serialis]|uniref:uncharacterized protein n=1 Tax=Fomitopsis serialis TaxID=139415 RepID=UPI002008078D|nr:uncharacterized protein B0H18DRAFT_219979 [Neoantrodia serialis]KAH9929156.1 hypothetical protein B0H18DRAFT_219979 [Neoantrodia serialis]